MGVTVTFVAILELVREGLIDIVQTEAYAPLHVRKAEGTRGLKLAVDNDSAGDDAVDSVTVVDDAPDVTADEVIMEDAMAANDSGIGAEEDDATDGETHE
jgi:segregation and condensation protein A